MNVHGPCARVVYYENAPSRCKQYESQPLHTPNCTGRSENVPRFLFASSKSPSVPYLVRTNAASNTEYELQYHNDTSAEAFVKRFCGTAAAKAYRCLIPPAYRSDLFRFCALASHGGVYLDADIALIRPIDQVVSRCSTATIGADFSQREGALPGKQMKILAGRQGAPIFQCMVNRIIHNVRQRYYGPNPLSITGPALLHNCYQEHAFDVAITYIDTRLTVWPFTGMRTRTKILAYEAPNEERIFPQYYRASEGMKLFPHRTDVNYAYLTKSERSKTGHVHYSLEWVHLVYSETFVWDKIKRMNIVENAIHLWTVMHQVFSSLLIVRYLHGLGGKVLGDIRHEFYRRVQGIERLAIHPRHHCCRRGEWLWLYWPPKSPIPPFLPSSCSERQ